PHHRLLIDRLERVARGEIKRLAVFMPPGSAKSTYGSILFPPYVMANAPNRAILAASHTTELAEKWGRRVRNLIAEHGATVGLRLSDDSTGARPPRRKDGELPRGLLRPLLHHDQRQLLQSALLCCVMEMGIDRILFAVDWPFVANKPAVQWMQTVPLCDEDKIKILSGNAKRLFKM